MKNILLFLFCFGFVSAQSQGQKGGYHFDNGVAKADNGDYQGAIEEYTKEIEVNPKFWAAYYNRGLARSKTQSYETAINDFSKAIDILFETGDKYKRGDYLKYLRDIYRNRGIAKVGTNDYTGALTDYNTGISLEPNDYSIFNYRGKVKILLEDYVGAKMDFYISMSKNEKFAEAYYNMGIAKVFLGQPEWACLDFSKALELGDLRAADELKKYCKIFSSANAPYTFMIPSDMWKMVQEPNESISQNAEFIYGERTNGLLRIKKEVVDNPTTLADHLNKQISSKFIFLPGYTAGQQYSLPGNLKGISFNYSFMRQGTKMAGQLYVLQVNERTYYLLEFTGLYDKLNSIENEMRNIAASFTIK